MNFKLIFRERTVRDMKKVSRRLLNFIFLRQSRFQPVVFDRYYIYAVGNARWQVFRIGWCGNSEPPLHRELPVSCPATVPQVTCSLARLQFRAPVLCWWSMYLNDGYDNDGTNPQAQTFHNVNTSVTRDSNFTISTDDKRWLQRWRNFLSISMNG